MDLRRAAVSVLAAEATDAAFVATSAPTTAITPVGLLDPRRVVGLHSSTSSETMTTTWTTSRGQEEDRRRRFVYNHYVYIYENLFIP
jgi:hypothetical protein